jgi:DNA photolyase
LWVLTIGLQRAFFETKLDLWVSNSSFFLFLKNEANSQQIRMAGTKRKSKRQGPVGAKRAKAATEYAAVTKPGIPEDTPLSKLLRALDMHHKRVSPKTGNVVHWFRSDLRVEDNRGLRAASQKAQENGKALIALYVVSPQVMTRYCLI